jgi:predicted lipoprotein with Yx(FWY)xxD motif
MRPRLALIAIALGAAALVAMLAAGCGGNDSSGGPSHGNGGTTSNAASGGAGGVAAVAVANNPQLGEILVDGNGRTLYLFEKDESDESYCNGDCAKVWPPETTNGDPKAGDGAQASKLGTLKREDGSTQVTYNGSPLYLYASDTKAGDAKGNELDQFGAEWYALRSSGEKAEGQAPAGGSGGGQGGGGQGAGGGYGY